MTGEEIRLAAIKASDEWAEANEVRGLEPKSLGQAYRDGYKAGLASRADVRAAQADAWDEGWNEGYDHCYSYGIDGKPNPYRQDPEPE